MKLFLTKLAKKFLVLLVLISLKLAIQEVGFTTLLRSNISQEVIAVGNSHMQRFTTQIFNDATNLSQPAQTYEVGYFQTKTLIEKGIIPKYLIIEFAPYNFGHFRNIYLEDRFLERMSGISIVELLSNDFMTYEERLKVLKYKITNLKTTHPFINSFTCPRTKNEALASIDLWIKGDFYDLQSGKQNMVFLEKTFQLAKQHNIQLVAIRFPLHPEAEREIPNEFLQAYQEYHEKLKKNFDDQFIYLDYTQEFNSKADFRDYDHLNCSAGEELSRRVKEELNL